jgi:glycosyltransferase involved in cell wall biosynthesis
MKTIILLDKRTSYSIKRYTLMLLKISKGEIVSFGSSITFMALIQKYILVPFKLWASKPLNIILPSEGYSYLLPFLKKHKTILICHDLHDLMNVNVNKWRKCILKKQLRNLKNANHLVAISEHTKHDFTKLFGEKFTSKMIVIHNPIEDFWFDSIIFKPQKFDNCKLDDYILVIGSIAWYKNLDRAFEALSNIPNINIVRVGPMKPSWKKVVASDRLFIYDNLTDVEIQWLYQNAKLLFFPSIHEGFGWPLLEAMASKCYIVTSKKASIPEICKNVVCYIDPYDVNSMSETIQKTLNNKSQQEAFTEEGLILASTFRMDAYTNKILNLINE